MGKRVYSTGPVENQSGDTIIDPSFIQDKLFATIVINVLNNDDDDKVRVKVKTYDIDGEKRLVEKTKYKVKEEHNYTTAIDVTELDRFEIQIQVSEKDTLLSLTGKNYYDEIVRELNFIKID